MTFIKSTSKKEMDPEKSFLSFCREITKEISEHRLLAILAVLFLAGIAIGAVFARSAKESTLTRLDFLFVTNFRMRMKEPFFAGFVSSLSSSFIFVFFCFLCGLSAWGVFILPFVPVIRGFGLGLLAGHLYVAYGIQGFLFHLLVLIPGACVGALSILLAAQEGMKFSRKIAAGAPVLEKGKEAGINVYLTRFGVIMLIALAAAAVDFLMAAVFSGFFSF